MSAKKTSADYGLSSDVLPLLDSEREKVLLSFQKSLCIKFKNIRLLNIALMHSSLSNESGHHYSNERLEFLGDAILGAIAATLLYKEMVDKAEGELAKIKSVIVSETILAEVARELQIDHVLMLGHGEEMSGGRDKNAILADALEALIGALYLDSGYDAAFAFAGKYINTKIGGVINEHNHENYKSLLQELCQHRFKTYPLYRLVRSSGPDHDRFFWVEVTINGKPFGQGQGKNKKSAEQEAAKVAYETLI
jgi:ribonuclease-3